MISLYFEFLVPFLVSAVVVILISLISEQYGTKFGGVIGTLPSTILIAYVFIAYNEGIHTATQAVAVVPAVMGINVLFLLLFVLFSSRSLSTAVTLSLSIWALFSLILFIINMTNILGSLLIFGISFFIAVYVLEQIKKTRSLGRVPIRYTPLKIALRGLFAGIIIACAVLLSNMGAVLSGIFSAFPVIFLSTMIIETREQGPLFAAGLAKSMVFGSPSVVVYATAIYFFYPSFGIFTGSIMAFLLSVFITLFLYKISKKLK